MSSPSPAIALPRLLRMFISHASEDSELANAIANGLRSALGQLAEINIDTWSLQPGQQFKEKFAEQLSQSEYLVIIYTGVDKPSHGFTGWEVGFFEARQGPEKKKIVPMYLKTPPDVVAGYQGIHLGIPDDLLRLSLDEFAAKNQVQRDDPMCLLIQELQETVDRYTDEARLPRNRTRPEPQEAFRNMRLEIFRYLKTTVEATFKPQKQITIKTMGGTLREGDGDLPPDAILIPVGKGNPMSTIFGLPNQKITWGDFVRSMTSRQRQSWSIAIASVVTSSLEWIDSDNSQIILSLNGLAAYRVILTTAIRYYDGSQEFNLHFVETWQRKEYGDEDTTLLLKGLELVCRYRFMFLENRSEFSSGNISIKRTDDLPGTATELLRELNLMGKDSLNAGLDQATVWTRFVDWGIIRQMAETYGPAEKCIRDLIGEILKKRDKPEELITLRDKLSAALKQLADVTEPYNCQLIKAMAHTLQAMVESQARPPQ